MPFPKLPLTRFSQHPYHLQLSFCFATMPFLLFFRIGILSLCLLFFVSPVHAQIAVVEADPTPSTKPVDINLGLGRLNTTDLKKSNGAFSRFGLRAGLNAEYPLGSAWNLEYIFAYEWHKYDFSSSSPFNWDNIHRFAYAPLFKWRANEEWTVLGAPFLQWVGESGADVDDAFSGGGLVGFHWFSSPDLSLGLLIGVISQIEDDALMAPIPLVNWRVAERWVLRVGPHNLGPTVGLGGEVAWQYAKSFELTSGIQFQRRRFRLDKRDRIGQETVLPLFIKWNWLLPLGQVEFFGSLATNGTLRLENKNGNKITDKDNESTYFWGGKVHFYF